MKRLLFFVPLFFLAVSTPAQHRNIFSRTARLAGRTLVNMATCRDKVACADEWGAVISGGLDSYETGQYMHFCPNCLELNPILGKRPGQARVWGTVVGFSFIMAMQTQGFRELMRKQDDWMLRDVIPAIPSAIYTEIELKAFSADLDVANRFKKCAVTVGCFRN